MPIRLVVGLGNPGPEYRHTRHNVGFRLVERLSIDGSGWRNWKDSGRVAEARWGQEVVHLAEPTTYMNLSGRMVRSFAQFHKIPPADILVCFDDFQLPLAKIRIRLKGSAGGHNGMQSVIDEMGSMDIPRLRIGIGPLPKGVDPAEFVLRKMSRDDELGFERGIFLAHEAVREAVERGVESAMNRYNPSPSGSPES